MPDPDWTEPGQKLTYLWMQYKYRHELCWSAIYKITFAVILLGLAPYMARTYNSAEFMEFVHEWLWVPPFLAMCLAGFGVFVVNNELKLFAATKLAHYRLEDQLLGRLFEPLHEKITAENARWTRFDCLTHALILALFFLAIGNFVLALKYG